MNANTGTRQLGRIDRSVWALGFVSMFMDISSEMIHSLLPLYLVGVLGASALTVGLIEGIAEATASISKIFSGALSDYLGKRKLLAAIGYAMSAFTKPIFPLASSLGWVVAARFLDRVGKGVRGAPRDALVADVTPEALRGAAYGLRQSLDTVGAFVGPLLALVLMYVTASQFKTVFWAAVLPAFVAVAIMIFAVREPVRAGGAKAARSPIRLADVRALPSAYWEVVAIGAVLALARFSEAFLILRSQNLGLRVMFAPLVLVLMNIVYALGAYPAGRWSDRVNKRWLLVAGLALLIVSDLVLAYAAGLVAAALGIVLWGAHMAMTQGLFATLVAQHAPAALRGTAFGVFNLLSGIAMLGASVLAGALWDSYGPGATFIASAVLTAGAVLGLLLLGRQSRQDKREAST